MTGDAREGKGEERSAKRGEGRALRNLRWNTKIIQKMKMQDPTSLVEDSNQKRLNYKTIASASESCLCPLLHLPNTSGLFLGHQ